MNVYRPAAAIAFVLATAAMWIGVGTPFVLSSNQNEGWRFFSAWLFALAMVGLTRFMMVGSRRKAGLQNPRVLRWTDIAVGAETAICVFYLLWGISKRVQGL